MAKKAMSGTGARAKGKSSAKSGTKRTAALRKSKGERPAAAGPSMAGKRSAPRRKAAALGRPKISADEKLYLLFKEDYHARQVFAFLRVETVRELEQHSPKQIVKLLSRPIQETVERIRQKLADNNRFLLDDAEFAIKHQRQT